MLGPNGAGKTTAVEILEGYRKRTSGEVSVLGVDPANSDSRWRKTARANNGDSTATIALLSSRFGGENPDLTVGCPSLEDVYLQMIGQP